MNKATYDELVKLIGEERAKPFADQVDDANRTIAESGMITRADETPPAETVPLTPAPTEVRQDAPPAEKPADGLAALQAQVAELSARVAKLEESYGVGMEESKRTQERSAGLVTELAARLVEVEASKKRWDAWLNDAPEYVKDAEKIVRARDQEPAPLSMAEIGKAKCGKTAQRAASAA